MNNKFIKSFLVNNTIFFIGTCILYAQESIQKDSSNHRVTYFKNNINQRYQGNEFNYSINDTGGINLLQKVLQKFFGWLNDVFGIDIDWIDYQTLEFIIYALLGIITLYLLVKFLTQTPLNSIFKNESLQVENFNYTEKNISDVNFETLIEAAINEKNYRLATRYSYLKSLKILSNKDFIDWHFDKTNNDYYNEIKDENLKSAFKRVSYLYDYIWYGEFPIDEAKFKLNQLDFDTLNNL